MATKTVLLNDGDVSVDNDTMYYISLKINNISPKKEVSTDVKNIPKDGEFNMKVGKGTTLKGSKIEITVSIPVIYASADGNITIDGTGFNPDTQAISPYSTYILVEFKKTIYYT